MLCTPLSFNFHELAVSARSGQVATSFIGIQLANALGAGTAITASTADGIDLTGLL